MAKNKFNDNSGPSQRQLRVGELIRRALSEILMQGIIHDPDLNKISVTVSEVSASPDLKIATAYVCPLGGEGGEDLIALLAKNKSEIRRSISNSSSSAAATFLVKATNKFTPRDMFPARTITE